MIDSSNYIMDYQGQLPDLSDLFDESGDGMYWAKPGGELDGVASWKNNDPWTDYDGDLRPAVTNASDYAGADIP